MRKQSCQKKVCQATRTSSTCMTAHILQGTALYFVPANFVRRNRTRLLCAAEYCVAPPPPCLPTIATSVAQQKGFLGQVTVLHNVCHVILQCACFCLLWTDVVAFSIPPLCPVHGHEGGERAPADCAGIDARV